MSILFEPITLNHMTLANRFVRSATWEAMAEDDGSSTQRLADLLVRLAKGGVGLIIAGHATVRRDGQAGPKQLGIYGDALLPGLSDLSRTVHEAGGKIVVQLAHAGCHGVPSLSGFECIGPSAMSGEKVPACREATRKEIHEIVEAFGDAAARAKKAGFDGVQIHAAHGYFLSEFLSPFYNKRNDEYGGSIENRARVVLAAYENIRSKVGKDFPVLIKLNSQDFVDGGFSLDDMLHVVSRLEEMGIDAIELSGGTTFSGKLSPVRVGDPDTTDKEAYYRQAAAKYKEKIKVPLILVGGIRSFDVAEQLVRDGLADCISLSRPLICEPDLVNRWKAGDRRRSECASDNMCFRPALKGEGIYCLTKEKKSAR
jgi:2,4-dienoyl-CoA reductase-like NADH-dependent reductase (Old Yellow Enzyme family)